MLTKKQFEIMNNAPLDVMRQMECNPQSEYSEYIEHDITEYREQHGKDLDLVQGVNYYRGGALNREHELCIREMSDHAGSDKYIEYLEKLEQRDFTNKVKEIFKPNVKIIQIQITSEDHIIGLGDNGVVYINSGYEWRVHTPLVFESSK